MTRPVLMNNIQIDGRIMLTLRKVACWRPHTRAGQVDWRWVTQTRCQSRRLVEMTDSERYFSGSQLDSCRVADDASCCFRTAKVLIRTAAPQVAMNLLLASAGLSLKRSEERRVG